jgi:threonylcarbamoyladenosine tRNA methylthiotransferase MtaB
MPGEEPMKIHLSSLGCKLNQSEMEALANRLAASGHQIVALPAEADLCVLNTCAVTHVAAQKSRQALRRLHRESPAARLVATGCYAELAPADLRDLPGVHLVAGNRDKERLAELLGDRDRGLAPVVFHLPRSRTRAFVKIQDGCDNSCTYCIIHLARGPQWSRPADQILAEVRARLVAGYQEIVLTGVHIGAYGRDRSNSGPAGELWDLVARILAETGVPRLRLSSIEPWDLPERAFRLWDDPRLCPHLHLPLQSGSDATLHRMARRTDTTRFAALIDAARAAIPDLAVTTDVIVGFPGETGQEFAASLAFVQAAGFARVHVFPYSRRPGTPAALMPDQVPSRVKAERAAAMRAVASSSACSFRRRFVGRTLAVLWESCRGGEVPVWSGLTGNYMRVEAASAANLHNTLTSTRLLSLVGERLRGEIETKNGGQARACPPACRSVCHATT